MKKIGIGIIALLVIGIATATYYLSNSVTANVHVDKPMSMRMGFTNGTWIDPLELGDVYGGSSVEFIVETTAHSVIPIGKSSQVYKVENTDVNCDYFDVVTIDGGDILQYCINGTGYVDFVLPSVAWSAGQINPDTVDLTFALFAEGDYQVIVDVRYNG